MNYYRANVWIVCLLMIHGSLYGQTCCSGGVPISTNIGFATEQKGMLHVAVSADFNNLSSLYAGGDKLDNNNRERNTNALFLRLGYDWSEKFSTEVLLPYIIQKRAITQNNGDVLRDQSNGLGDIVALARYNLITGSSLNVALSAGIKLNNGSFSETNNQGLLLINDLQPGSGSVDGLFRADLAYSLSFRSNMNVFSSASYQLKGSNDEYLGSLDYKFGDEIQLSAGISSQEFILGEVFTPSVGLRYRQRTRDILDSFELDNTGGTWILAQLGMAWDIKQNSKFSVLFDLPVYTYIDGTQLSNDYVINLSFYQKLKL